MARSIFISYRRSDSKAEARSICQRLQKRFGKRNVFIDVDAINPGRDFRAVLEEHLLKCRVMIVVVGPRWLDILNASRTLDNPESNDFVQMEVVSALKRDLSIIPVLVDGASMPVANDLPDDLKPSAFRQAFAVRHDSFPRDMTGLEQELCRNLGGRVAGKIMALLVGILFLGGLYYFLSQHYLLIPPSAEKYSHAGSFACFDKAEYPGDWRSDAALCASYGCNFGRLSRQACLALGARKNSKTVIHGNANGGRANECWLQQSCGDLRPHSDFSLYRL